MSISDEAVEAAAKIVYRTSGRKRVMDYEEARAACVAEAREILEAAAPYIRAEALLDAAQAAIDPTSEDMDKYFIDQSDTGRWLRARAAVADGC